MCSSLSNSVEVQPASRRHNNVRETKIWLPDSSSKTTSTKEMDASVQHVGQAAEASGHVVWTASMSSYMLSHLAGLVANGTRTSSGFKKVHLNGCARALNDHFKMRLTGDQIGHHVRTWRRKYVKICGLRNLSGALWDEDSYTIRLDHDQYTGHINAHKSDAEYLNQPIEHYGEMLTIFGNSLATGKYAKGSSDPLGTAETESEVPATPNENAGDVNGVPTTPDLNAASAPRPKKMLKTSHNEEDGGLIGAFKLGCQMVSDAILKSATASTDVPSDLYATLESLPGFEDTHVSDYFDYFVDHPSKARAFMQKPFEVKLSSFAKFVSDQDCGN